MPNPEWPQGPDDDILFSVGKSVYPDVYKYQFSFPVNPRFTVFRITNTIHKETIFTGVGASRLPPTFLGFEFDGFVDLWFSLKSWIHGLNGACRRYQGACGVNLLWFILPILIVGKIHLVSNSHIGIEMALIPNQTLKTGLEQIVSPKWPEWPWADMKFSVEKNG